MYKRQGQSGCGPEGENDSKNAAAEAEQQALGEHLAPQTGACGPERKAQGHVALTSGGLCEEQIRDVGAGNGKNEKNDDGKRGEEDEDGVAFTRWKRSGLFKDKVVAFVGRGIGLPETLCERGQFCCGFGPRYSWFEPCKHIEPVELSGTLTRCVGGEFWSDSERYPELGVENLVCTVKSRCDDCLLYTSRCV